MVILAGGQSRRMGRDKAFLPLFGFPLLERVIRRVVRLGPVVVAAGTEERARAVEGLGYPVTAVADAPEFSGRGPLAGIQAGLLASPSPWNLVVGCDMPLASPPLARLLLSASGAASAAIPVWEGRAQPLHGVYRKDCAFMAAEFLSRGESRMGSFLSFIGARLIGEEELRAFGFLGGAPFLGANTPGEFGELERRFFLDALEQALLRPTTSPREVEEACRKVLEAGLGAVAVFPRHVPLARSLVGRAVRVVAVVGFPLGQSSTRMKAEEAREAVEAGAEEVDVVADLQAAAQGRWDEVEGDLRAVVRAAGVPVKAILETGLLSPEAMRRAVLAAEAAGCAFVKTGTGYGPRPCAFEDVRLLRALASPITGVKAAGGIGEKAGAKELLEAGADRIGSSAALDFFN